MKYYSHKLLLWLTQNESWENHRQVRADSCCPALQSSALICFGRTLSAYMMTDAGQQGLRVASTLAFGPSPYLSQCLSSRANASHIHAVKVGLLWCSLSAAETWWSWSLASCFTEFEGRVWKQVARVTVNTKDYSFANANLEELTGTSKVCLPFGPHTTVENILQLARWVLLHQEQLSKEKPRRAIITRLLTPMN